MITPPSITNTFPYTDLPQAVSDEIEKLNKAASILTIAMVISIFVPAGFLFVIAFGIMKLIQSSKLTRLYPDLKKPKAQFSGRSRSEIKKLSYDHVNLKRVMEFADARKAFWVAIFFPILFIGGIAAFIAFT